MHASLISSAPAHGSHPATTVVGAASEPTTFRISQRDDPGSASGLPRARLQPRYLPLPISRAGMVSANTGRRRSLYDKRGEKSG
ncbi:hypothetical protein B0H10DRAFT_2070969 [Mycena sp. CBHHK59/15]|nr:hypothetical protein B0H10DRAFT_2070969 [Mycena sp. CBHHK59/15]